MLHLIKITGVRRGIKSILLIAIILLFRNVLNRSSIKRVHISAVDYTFNIFIATLFISL